MTTPTPSGSHRSTRRAVLSLGSNLGDRFDNIQGALDALVDAPEIDVVAISPIYETEPVGGPRQQNFLNVVVLADTGLSSLTLLERVQGVEDAFHRTREVRWGPRTLDIDVIAVGTERRDDEVLTLPHPRAHERAFVLRPWLDVEPDAELPGRGAVTELLAGLGDQWMQLRVDLALQPPD
ncbi:2-amino-4-hydroxy-6-hydroxymethyldihydropteridine diphosphokinase [Allonocardiopsis opalescens]|uniref:2-amino-4-hydroxy-6-hydroxymethyldihydropteridine diphosphokinase n=1 Tax=Allonocardiopsis opalescens TaxID=1144618 RepID=A0A2T0Q213_9ACTN|nr:2-amino-4-hydroxy-6-hydroxymethyldihydropteridine diphosphokinase [Allonocardiopsis opalescens]PRX97842.1 2-amino-4-hydroxy-6-hydroxymethyldihydropteridine diphosphokinase [Allonocardiopsis opalescens]